MHVGRSETQHPHALIWYVALGEVSVRLKRTPAPRAPFAECRRSGTRRRLLRQVPPIWHLAKLHFTEKKGKHNTPALTRPAPHTHATHAPSPPAPHARAQPRSPPAAARLRPPPAPRRRPRASPRPARPAPPPAAPRPDHRGLPRTPARPARRATVARYPGPPPRAAAREGSGGSRGRPRGEGRREAGQ